MLLFDEKADTTVNCVGQGDGKPDMSSAANCSAAASLSSATGISTESFLAVPVKPGAACELGCFFLFLAPLVDGRLDDTAAHAWAMASSRESGSIEASLDAASTDGGDWREMADVTKLGALLMCLLIVLLIPQTPAVRCTTGTLGIAIGKANI